MAYTVNDFVAELRVDVDADGLDHVNDNIAKITKNLKKMDKNVEQADKEAKKSNKEKLKAGEKELKQNKEKIKLSQKLKQNYASFTKTMKPLRSAIRNVWDALSSFKSMLVGIGSVYLLDMFANSLDAIGKLNRLIGVSTGRIQEMRYAMESLGGSSAEADDLLMKFSRILGSAKRGRPEMVEAFAELGITLWKNNGAIKTQMELMKEVSDVASKMSPEESFSALSSLGLSLGQMKFLSNSWKDIQATLKKGKSLGVASKKGVDEAERVTQAITDFKQEATAILSQILPTITPLLNKGINAVTQFLGESRDFFKGGGTVLGFIKNIFGKVIDGVAELAKDFVNYILNKVKSVFDGALKRVEGWINQLLRPFRELYNMITGIFNMFGGGKVSKTNINKNILPSYTTGKTNPTNSKYSYLNGNNTTNNNINVYVKKDDSTESEAKKFGMNIGTGLKQELEKFSNKTGLPNIYNNILGGSI